MSPFPAADDFAFQTKELETKRKLTTALFDEIVILKNQVGDKQYSARNTRLRSRFSDATESYEGSRKEDAGESQLEF